MSIFVTSTKAPVAASNNSVVIGFNLAIITVMLVTAQLFSYEKFPQVIADMWLPGGLPQATVTAALIVTLEVLMLPFLLRMQLSTLMRYISMVAGWVVVITWLGLSIWQNTSVDPIGSAGLFGATVAIPVGWWTTLASVAFGVLIAWASWGMWPGKQKR